MCYRGHLAPRMPWSSIRCRIHAGSHVTRANTYTSISMCAAPAVAQANEPALHCSTHNYKFSHKLKHHHISATTKHQHTQSDTTHSSTSHSLTRQLSPTPIVAHRFIPHSDLFVAPHCTSLVHLVIHNTPLVSIVCRACYITHCVLASVYYYC